MRVVEHAPLRAALAGIAHGTLEWLPVSSSGHVALLASAARWPEAEPAHARQLRTLEVALHTGSLLPLGWRAALELRRAGRRELQLRLLAAGAGATAITSVLGAAVGPAIERRSGGPAAVAGGLAAGSLALLLAERRAPLACTAGEIRLARLTAADVATLGLAQSVALWPGVSRRAATLAAARARGYAPQDASALSWLAGWPTLLGASAWQGARDRAALRAAAPTVAAGVAASAATGLLTRRLPDATARWPAAAWAAWRLALAVATLRGSHTMRRVRSATTAGSAPPA
ncbi:MAG: undecaprenyl-diphosphate phosphatase [Patulibacter sp.]